ncbi:polysaccharide biosynthesis protein [Gemmatirosa kalamazoonensis]|uniref:Polysaccharide biosynthesis protein n=1 Tax=Gemmatirosa kalamazoonensis TaxID=861299 RepID=W0RIW0_9BACT|nr:lipopolysaccharide biosynthesis protein [Gemmatirosa kalamazoonensis]AHG91039.1 polysaccharide biosynthesis protein [Gemmatirosa kalamazoonensis]
MLIRNTLLYLVARGGPGLLNFAALVLFARLVTPDQYGRYALVVAVAALVNSLGFYWLRLGLLRMNAVHGEDPVRWRSSVLLGFVGAVVPSAVAVGIVLARNGMVVGPWLVVAGVAMLVAQGWFELNLEFATASAHPVTYGMMSLAKAALLISGGVLLTRLGLGAEGLVIALAASFVLPGAWAALRQWSGVSVRRADRHIVRELLVFGLPFTLTFAFEYIVSTSDRLFLGAYHGASTVGVYAVSYDLAQQSLGMLMIVVNLAAYPITVRAFERGGMHGARGQLERHCTLLAALAMPAAMGLALCAPALTTTLLATAYRETGREILPWIAFAALVLGLKSYYFDIAFQLSRKTRLQVAAVACGAVVNLALNLLWIPTRGVLGAAYSTLAGYLVGLTVSWWLGRRECRLPVPWSQLGRIVLATAAMAAAILPLRSIDGVVGLLLQAAVGTAVYGAALVALDVMGVRARVRAMVLGATGQKVVSADTR